MDPIQQLNKITAQLDEMGNLNNQLLTGNNGLSRLDIDLLKQQCTSLYELIITLSPTTSQSISTEEIPASHIPSESTQLVVPEKEDVTTETVQIEERPIETKTEITQEPTLFTPPEPVVERKKAYEPIRNDISLHEKIANIKQPDVRSRLSDAKVESLKAAINLNKKIAFVNELFKENTVEYAKAIDKLNSAIDLNEALRYFNELKHHYTWSNDHELVNDLEQLIQKRFR